MTSAQRTSSLLGVLLLLALGTPSRSAEHPGRESIEKTGYQGPSTCEACHPGTARAFLATVHWRHGSKVSHVENTDPAHEYGMRNRVYTMCNGNDIVNNLKQIEPNPQTKKPKFSGCNTCHPGNHLSDVASEGPEAEAAVDCLLCHSSRYDFSRRKPFKDEQGRVVLGQDRSKEAALAVGRPGVKNCMACHEAAGGGVLLKRGFAFTKETDAHAAKGMVCVDCHRAKDHRIPTGWDPNNWAHDGLRLSCAECHQPGVHEDEVLDRHTARVACQTCHIPRTGGAFAKDFTRWTQGSDKYYEPSTLRRDANQTAPVYAWYNRQVANTPHFIGPKGSREDPESRIYPFKVFQGKGFFDRKTGHLLAMDFGPPMSTGDVKAGLESAARTLGLSEYDPVPGWQTTYFGSNHLVTRKGALTCPECHAPNGVLDLRGLGYAEVDIARLTSPELYFEREAARQAEEW